MKLFLPILLGISLFSVGCQVEAEKLETPDSTSNEDEQLINFETTKKLQSAEQALEILDDVVEPIDNHKPSLSLADSGDSEEDQEQVSSGELLGSLGVGTTAIEEDGRFTNTLESSLHIEGVDGRSVKVLVTGKVQKSDGEKSIVGTTVAFVVVEASGQHSEPISFMYESNDSSTNHLTLDFDAIQSFYEVFYGKTGKRKVLGNLTIFDNPETLDISGELSWESYEYHTEFSSLDMKYSKENSGLDQLHVSGQVTRIHDGVVVGSLDVTKTTSDGRDSYSARVDYFDINQK